MTTSIARSRARCKDCGRSFRVPDPERTYRCKACGGTVHTDQPGEPASAGTSSEPREEALADLKRADRAIGLVTVGYRLGAASYAFAAALTVMALARAEVPRGEGILVVGATTGLSVVLLLGALHLRFRPFVWTVVVAVLATAVSVVHFVGPNPLGVAVFASAAWALAAWFGLVPSYRFRRCIERHKDLYVLHHASAATRRSLKGRTPEERHERLVSAMRKAALRTWKLSAALAAGLIVASVAGTWLVLSTMRPRDFAPALERFESAWNGADLEQVSASFDPAVREVEVARLAGRLSAHGLGGDRPRLVDGQVTREGARASVDYLLGDLPLSTDWILTGTDWVLVHAHLPIPDLGPTLERFLEAWSDSDPQAVASFFAPGARAEMLQRIEEAIAGRGWESLPPVQGSEVRGEATDVKTALLTLEDGAVTTEWHFRVEGIWRLHRLRLPRR